MAARLAKPARSRVYESRRGLKSSCSALRRAPAPAEQFRFFVAEQRGGQFGAILQLAIRRRPASRCRCPAVPAPHLRYSGADDARVSSSAVLCLAAKEPAAAKWRLPATSWHSCSATSRFSGAAARLKSRRCPSASAARRRIPWRARSMKPSITSPIAARSFRRRWPHSPSRRDFDFLDDGAGEIGEGRHLRPASVSASNNGWRVAMIAAFMASMRANRISPTRPISVLEIRVSSVWRDTIRGRRSASQGRCSRFIAITAT